MCVSFAELLPSSVQPIPLSYYQTVQFFGYTSLACYVFFLMMGAVGFFSSLQFVRYMYKNVKLD